MKRTVSEGRGDREGQRRGGVCRSRGNPVSWRGDLRGKCLTNVRGLSPEREAIYGRLRGPELAVVMTAAYL